ncbi:hypothetical protein CPB83DRAFT_894447 [Crepidotus variabilis]|uniref:Molybdate-anion transporter n=1 Tax=Crepidotus variabilis TaxID=179855 RepID=A0A9P6EF66_9AGAR|nr:hypothetical protein CPB83DRAFT_894447 [Crepidotus variabilis]
MPRGFYELQLLILAGVCFFSLLVERYVARRAKKSPSTKETADDRLENGGGGKASSAALAALTWKYLLVYGIVMGADWLQGPYVYTLYREQYQFPERMVAVFFVTGFLSAGLAAPMVGAWADEHGRRKMCLIFCLTYAISCVCIMIPSMPILLFGRVLGGFSTSILFSAFESWLISSANNVSLPSADLSTIMGRATLINGLVATAAGVVSNQLVSTTRNFVAPFAASGVLLLLAWLVIRNTWTENFGRQGSPTEKDIFQVRRLGVAWNIVRRDPLLLVLGLTQTCFEGSMYLFVFLWVPSLQEHTIYHILPFGYIFSGFMISMMLGSLLYTAIVSFHQRVSSRPGADSSLTLHAKLSSLVCAVSALALASSVVSHDERVRFWAFCLFEACVGMYYPVQGTLRGTLISDEHRATLSSLFRVPLNIFVVVSLLTGVSSARTGVLSASALMLSFSSLMTGAIIVNRSEQHVLSSQRH